MARRKSRKPQPEDVPILLETPTAEKPKTRTSSFAAPALVLIITLTVGACIMGWFYVQQQSIDQLSESFTTMNQRITNFQQVMDMEEDQQSDPDLLVEERIFALEEAQKQAREKAEVALATSEELKNSDLLSQLWALHAEMNTRRDEIKQAALSVTTLQGMFKNQSEEFEVIKERVVAGLSFSSALSETVAGLTRVAEQDASVEALNAQIEGQASELRGLSELLYLHNVALHSHNQEMAAIKEIVKAKQAMRAQALEETLSSVRMILDEQFFTSQTLHSRIMAQLHTFHSELANGPSLPINHKSLEEGHPAEELLSNTAQDVSELQEKMEDAQEKAEEEEEEEEEEEDVEDDTEEQSDEDVMQEEQLPEERVDEGVIETQEDEIAPEEQVEEEITGQSEEQEDAGETKEETKEETADEETKKETVDEETADEETEDEEAEDEAEDEEAEDEAADEETADKETEDEETEDEETADEETADKETEDEETEDEETADEETADKETEDEETEDEETEDEETADEETADKEAADEEAAEDETAEENTSVRLLKESSEEEDSKAELNSDDFMDTQEEDE